MSKFFKYPFATGGDKATVPNPAQGDGTVSYQEGWGPDYSLDPGGGPPAQNIPRDQFNQIMYDVTTALQTLQVHGAPDWITSSDNDGSAYSYDIYSWCRHNSALWYSLVNANTAEPGTDGTKWQQFPPPAQFNSADIMASYDITLPSGWLWLDGKTIGDATSGGTARANADTSALFTVLWNSVPNSALPLQDSSGNPVARGVSAAVDFAAHRRMPLPDWRGRVGAGKDDLGGTAANRLTNAVSGIAGTTLGANGGAQSVTLDTTMIPAHSHTGNTSTDGNHFHEMGSVHTSGSGTGGSGFVALKSGNDAPNGTVDAGATDSAGSHNHTLTINNTGGGLAHPNVQPTITVMYRIKL